MPQYRIRYGRPVGVLIATTSRRDILTRSRKGYPRSSFSRATPDRHLRTRRKCTNSLKALSDRPEIDTLRRFLKNVLNQRRGELEFVVLFGSMARGDWSRGSDYDVFIGLRIDDQKRLLDRMGDYDALIDGNIEVFPYGQSEWKRMFEDRSAFFLEALHHGVVLFDRGAFADMRALFQRWVEADLVKRSSHGWQIRWDVSPEQTERSA